MVSVGLGGASPGTWVLEPERGGTHRAFCKGDPSHHVHSFPLVWLMLSPVQAREAFPIISPRKAWEGRDGVLGPITLGWRP